MLVHLSKTVTYLSNSSLKRTFSLLSTHNRTPAPLYRFQYGRQASLFDITQEGGGWSKDAVLISSDGLVHPQLLKSSPYSNGPVFMPNTRTMQQMLRFDFERYEEAIEDGKSLVCPVILHIEAGTPISPRLILWREGTSRFSLQPQSPLSLDEFNGELQDFYSQSAISLDVKSWIENNPYKESAADHDETKWMQS
ncbi:uncharacterized protein N7483_009901 [Penicillium malachiteum]|uniref:uncharacterized protein n=1 Tax=Penicillium malachiteum TaxID=1324776 RepID=UPI0025482868|nr:uncharacterized protein N7483_009901 [Penicillium malachiteum]KAJ5718819.1 hypothetical protein N7483_009901 [Penicillium malachiteum]